MLGVPSGSRPFGSLCRSRDHLHIAWGPPAVFSGALGIQGAIRIPRSRDALAESPRSLRSWFPSWYPRGGGGPHAPASSAQRPHAPMESKALLCRPVHVASPWGATIVHKQLFPCFQFCALVGKWPCRRDLRLP